MTRKRIYEIIEAADENDVSSAVYDRFMLVVIILSLLPMTQRTLSEPLRIMDSVTVIIFIIDYILRLATADYKLNRGALSFIEYPFTFMAIVDLLSIIPSLPMMPRVFMAFRSLRILRLLRITRVLKVVRYSKNLERMRTAIIKQKDSLIAVFGFAIGYIIVTALVVFTIEPYTFGTFYQALYWATISLTTVGYGDIVVKSALAKGFIMLSSIFGIAILSLPIGIICAGYMHELEKSKDDDEESDS